MKNEFMTVDFIPHVDVVDGFRGHEVTVTLMVHVRPTGWNNAHAINARRIWPDPWTRQLQWQIWTDVSNISWQRMVKTGKAHAHPLNQSSPA